MKLWHRLFLVPTLMFVEPVLAEDFKDCKKAAKAYFSSLLGVGYAENRKKEFADIASPEELVQFLNKWKLIQVLVVNMICCKFWFDVV